MGTVPSPRRKENPGRADYSIHRHAHKQASMPSIWSIVPYWSTDLLYAVSLFTCRTRKELSTHAKRLVAAQFICTAGFLLFPLQFTFGRPHSVGVFGWMFDVLAIFDKP
ncbi:MAG: hypothetical protein DMG58_35555, partial [Acidobacteria bacterium]